MTRVFSIALRTALVTLVITGIIYPLLVTALANLLYIHESNGSLVRHTDGNVVGSTLIGQSFAKPWYFWPRPSAAGPDGYDAAASSGSNLGPTSRRLRDRVAAEAARLSAANPNAALPIPADLVTASASGLDPHLSPEAAFWQVPRVAQARNVAPERIRAEVIDHVTERAFGVFGSPRVNVLLLNLALDRRFGTPTDR